MTSLILIGTSLRWYSFVYPVVAVWRGNFFRRTTQSCSQRRGIYFEKPPLVRRFSLLTWNISDPLMSVQSLKNTLCTVYNTVYSLSQFSTLPCQIAKENRLLGA